jgi:hypothetical protein
MHARVLLALGVLALFSCAKKDAGAPPVGPGGPGGASGPGGPDLAEVEMSGMIESSAGGRLVFFVAAEPCDVERPVKVLGSKMPLQAAGSFFHEIFVPQGTMGHICAAAVDGDKVVGLGRERRNPFKMQGRGEVDIHGLKIVVEPLAAPVAVPAGL